MNGDAGGQHAADGADHHQVVVELGRPMIFDPRLGNRIGALAAIHRGALIDAERTQDVRPRPFDELQIIGVIDDARGISILDIDAQRETVLAIPEPAAIRRLQIPSAHRRSSRAARFGGARESGSAPDEWSR
jgi:hypothetical protein